MIRKALYLSLTLLFGFGLVNTGMTFEPLGVPAPSRIEYPNDVPPSPQEVYLGRVLFFGERLSVNNKFSCASCHNPDLGFGDGMATGIGAMGNLREASTVRGVTHTLE
jgi:cytochrome c peroxidase